MATELTVQSERAFLKQPHIFLNHKVKSTKGKRVGRGGRRWFKDIGLGFKTPRTAIEGTYIGMDNFSPFSPVVFFWERAKDQINSLFLSHLQTRNVPSPD
jgi:small subunit ribosomal protein S11e